MKRGGIGVCVLLLASVSPGSAKVVVFWQEGFPTIESQPVPQSSLNQALEGMQPVYASLQELANPQTLKGAELLVLPYGSAVPVEVWSLILGYLHDGGNLLTLGGRPLFVPVSHVEGKFVQGYPQNTYSRALGIGHTYEVPQKDWVRFEWDESFPSFGAGLLRARRVFVASSGRGRLRYRGVAYLLNSKSERVAAPVTKDDALSARSDDRGPSGGARCVFLNFEPDAGFWLTPAGITLLRDAAEYARQGATEFWIEMQNATLAAGENPQVVVHLRSVRRQAHGLPQQGYVRLQLFSTEIPPRLPKVLETRGFECSGNTVAERMQFHQKLEPGLYSIHAEYKEGEKAREGYRTGFWVRDENLLRSGVRVEPFHDYFLKNGAPFVPMGTNYFTTDYYGNRFVPGNAYVWERDFAEMEKHGVTFVRTGVWNNQADLLDPATGGVEERFLRGLEAFLYSAARHNIQVNFTFTAFDPQTIRRRPGETSAELGPGTNPYTDPVAVKAEQTYVLSIVNRFKDVPLLSWDLINEPSFSNPKRLWRGNTPNGDPTEASAWRDWLKRRYGTIEKLADAWNTLAENLGGFDSVPLPSPDDLHFTRAGNPNQVRAFDYNLFAQDMFSRWVSEMISGIRATGSKQMIDVGQDEGGVADRVLNQFYGGAGVSFTVNHTWWRDDSLLWDSVAAKRPGIPNFVGETGVQPVERMDSTGRWGELTALGLFERKLALGLAAANAGSLQWDWSIGDTFGIKRSDDSNKIWEDVLEGLSDFALKAAPYAVGAKQPGAAIVLPQSLQLSVFNGEALEAQQKCVRALYHVARASAYVVGEYQIELLGHPKLIILPSPWVLNSQAWRAILTAVAGGTTLLLSGRFDADEHFHETARASDLGLDYRPGLLTTRENLARWPGGEAWLSYSGSKTTYLDRGFLAHGQTYTEVKVGKGRILYFSLPIELNDNLQAIGEIYRFALRQAEITPIYHAQMNDPGILICPTQWERATLYVFTSESSEVDVRFRDLPSETDFAGRLEPGRAALLLVGRQGEVLATYNWHSLR